MLNGIPLAKSDNMKHLGIFFDERLTFTKHKEAMVRAGKGIVLRRFLSKPVDHVVLDTPTNFTCTAILITVTYSIFIRARRP